MAFAMLTAPLAVSGQIPTILKPVQIGVALGGAIPISDLGNNFNTGFNVTGTIGINPVALPVGFRVDAAYNQFGSKGATNVKAKFASVTGNVVGDDGGCGDYAICDRWPGVLSRFKQRDWKHGVERLWLQPWCGRGHSAQRVHDVH